MSHILCFAHNIQQFLVDNLDNFKRFLTGYRIDEYVTMKVHAILGRKYTVFILSSCINQFDFIVRGIDSGDFRKSYDENPKIYELIL